MSLALSGALIGPWLFGGVRLWSIGILLALSCASAIMTSLRPFLFGVKNSPLFPAALPVFGLFLAYSALRIPYSAVPYDAVLETVRMVGLGCSFWSVVNLVGVHHGRWRGVVMLLFLSASIMCLYALAQHFRGSRMVLNLIRPEVYEMRATGAFMCPNHFASLISIVLPVAAALIFCRDAGHLVRIFSAYALLVIPPSLFLTQSRSGWMGTLCGLMVTALIVGLRRGRKAFLVTSLVAPLVAIVLAGAAWSFSPMVRARVEDALRGNPRIQLWTDTVAMIRASPVTGTGAGSFRWIYPSHWHALREFTDPEHAHNETLELFAEQGAVGGALFLAGLFVAVGALLARARSASRLRDTALIAGTAGATTAALIHSCFDYNFHVWGVAAALMAFFGTTTSLLYASGDITRRMWLSGTWRRGIGVALALVAVVAVVIETRATISDLLVRRADAARLAMRGEDADAHYHRALAVDPGNYQAWMGRGHSIRMRMTWNLDAEHRKEQFDQAEAFYRQALVLNPLLLDAEVSLALLYNASGDAERALEMLRKVVDKAPLHRDNLCRLGVQLRRMGRTKEALEIFTRAEAMGSTEMIQLNLADLRASGT